MCYGGMTWSGAISCSTVDTGVVGVVEKSKCEVHVALYVGVSSVECFSPEREFLTQPATDSKPGKVQERYAHFAFADILTL